MDKSTFDYHHASVPVKQKGNVIPPCESMKKLSAQTTKGIASVYALLYLLGVPDGI
jgi:hypothetical protein